MAGLLLIPVPLVTQRTVIGNRSLSPSKQHSAKLLGFQTFLLGPEGSPLGLGGKCCPPEPACWVLCPPGPGTWAPVPAHPLGAKSPAQPPFPLHARPGSPSNGVRAALRPRPLERSDSRLPGRLSCSNESGLSEYPGWWLLELLKCFLLFREEHGKSQAARQRPPSPPWPLATHRFLTQRHLPGAPRPAAGGGPFAHGPPGTRRLYSEHTGKQKRSGKPRKEKKPE